MTLWKEMFSKVIHYIKENEKTKRILSQLLLSRIEREYNEETGRRMPSLLHDGPLTLEDSSMREARTLLWKQKYLPKYHAICHERDLPTLE